MAGTIAGGKAAAATNKTKYGKDYYQRIGAKGGATPNWFPKGFAAMSPEKRREAGRKGGTISRRRPKQTLDDLLHYQKPQPLIKRLFTRRTT